VATPGVVERCDLGVKRVVSHTLQPLMKGRQTAPQARLVGFPSPLEMSWVVARAVVGQAQKRERLRPFPWPPRLALGNTTARHEARFIRREGSSEFRQPRDQDLLEALRVGAGLEADHDIVHVATQVRLPGQAWFHATFNPQSQHVVERAVAQYHTAAPPLGYPVIARFDHAVFQPPGFQPPSHQAAEAWVADAGLHQATSPSLG
jgi:hypothetical protein